MTSKLKTADSDLPREIAPEEGQVWEKRNAATIKKQLAKSWQDIQGGKGIVFDPRDPFTFFENARKRYGKGKKTKS